MANFDPAFDKMIRNEGGFKLTNIEGDRGGQTYAGIERLQSSPLEATVSQHCSKRWHRKQRKTWPNMTM